MAAGLERPGEYLIEIYSMKRKVRKDIKRERVEACTEKSCVGCEGTATMDYCR